MLFSEGENQRGLCCLAVLASDVQRLPALIHFQGEVYNNVEIVKNNFLFGKGV